MSDVFGGSPARGIHQPQKVGVADRRNVHDIFDDLVERNNSNAADNRAYFDACGVFVVNLMSSPGAGKTALLEATIEALKDEFDMAVIEGDVEGENDAKRIRALGVPALQINTGCCGHLDADMVSGALHHLALEHRDILFVENVGNLVSPADFDLGQHCNITLLSVPEGDEKPAKYPKAFSAADLVLLSKTDLLHFMREFSPRRVEQGLRALGSTAPVLGLSAKEKGGLDIWLNWLRREMAAHRARLAPRRRTAPVVQPSAAPVLGLVPDRSQQGQRPGMRAAAR